MSHPSRSDRDRRGGGISRRGLLIGGGAGAGLLVGWLAWPRSYEPTLPVAEGDVRFNAWLAIRPDGSILVAMPQSEMGQGVSTVLPQIVAGELGADWRSVAVQPADDNPLYANALLAREWAPAILPPGAAPDLSSDAALWALDALAQRGRFVVTARSSSVRGMEDALREAAGAARTLLAMAAAERWDVAPEACRAENGFIVHGADRLRFAELAVRAAELDPPRVIPLLADGEDRLTGTAVPRLDLPAKIDGSANFGGDIRLPDMLYAALRRGPVGTVAVKAYDREAGRRVPGFVTDVSAREWVAALATDSFAARTAVRRMEPSFTRAGPPLDDGAIDAALAAALKAPGTVIARTGEAAAAVPGARTVTATYDAMAALHLPAEPRSGTARLRDGRLELWLATQAPGAARLAAAAALGIAENAVTLYPLFAGGSFGRDLDPQFAADLALLAQAAAASREGRAVQLVSTRQDDIAAAPPRPPVRARLSATIDAAGRIARFTAALAAPPTTREVMRWIVAADDHAAARRAASGLSDALAVEGLLPPYALAHAEVAHHPAVLPLATGLLRGEMDGLNAFFVESFIDELARSAGQEPLGYRMAMLSGRPRLARVLQRAAELGNWDGGLTQSGRSGSGKGIAAHAMRGAFIAVVAEAQTGENGIRVRRLSAAVDCGRLIHPDIARQQIEGGLIFGLAHAVGAATGYEDGYPAVKGLAAAGLPLLSDVPDIAVDFLPSSEEPGGYEEIGMAAVAPAIANALATLTGTRLRQLPLLSEAT